MQVETDNMRQLALSGMSATALELAFYEAISSGDIEALMSLWAEQDDIVCIHPGSGRLVGLPAIRNSFETLFERGKLVVKPTQVHALQSGNCVIHNLIEEVSGENDSEHEHEVYLQATNVYINTSRGWRIVLHHVSVTPGSAPAQPASLNLLH